jgi:branched-chain amino acid transport system ATP-binding protein
LLLEVANLSVWYDKAMLINNLSMGVHKGELVSLVGPNGAGKSTLLRSITGLVAWEREITRRSTQGDIILEGAVTFDGERIDQIPAHEIVRRGLILCPERRRPFREMTVIDNLMAGSYLLKNKGEIRNNLDKVYQLFPVLCDRSSQISGTLSGGEQQMLSIGRALMSDPRLLILDEPSLGIAPLLVEAIFNRLKEINEQGITLFIVEQNASVALEVAGRGYVMELGKIVRQDKSEVLMVDPAIRKAYLGG